MAKPIDPANSKAGHAGNIHYVTSIVAEFLKDDPGKDQDALQRVLKRLKDLKPEDLQKILEGMGKGGEAGLALAFSICESIAELNADDLLGRIQQINDRRRMRRRFAIVGIGLILAIGPILGFGRHLWTPGSNEPGAGDANSGSVLPSASPPACTLSFIQPSSPANIPDTGPVNFQWTDVPQALNYTLEVAPPANAGLPWDYPVKGTSKTIYMENFPSGGEYQISVKALSADGAVLCSVVLQFRKGAKTGKGPGNSKCIDTGILYWCP